MSSTKKHSPRLCTFCGGVIAPARLKASPGHRLIAGKSHQPKRLCPERLTSDDSSPKRLRSGFRDGLVLLPRSAADANRANDFAVLSEWNAAGKDHHLAIIGGMNPKELLPRLTRPAQLLRRDVKGARGPGLLDRYVDASQPCPFHALKRQQIAAAINDGNVHRLTNLRGFFRRAGDDLSRFNQIKHMCVTPAKS